MRVRIEIGEDWQNADFYVFFWALQRVANFAQTGEHFYLKAETHHVGDGGVLIRALADGERLAGLKVVEIKYSSPGFVELAGVSTVLSPILIFLKFAIEHYGRRNLRALEVDEKRLEIARKKYDFVVSLRETSGRVWTDEAIEEVANGSLDPLIALTLEKKVSGAREVVDKP